MTTLDSLLRMILERPEDDFARLAYADLLDDHGEPERGEFIRCQCELAHWQPYRPPPEIEELARSDRLYSFSAREVLAEKQALHDERKGYLLERERRLWAGYTDWVPQAVLDIPGAGLAFQLSEMKTPEGYVGGVWRRGFIHTIVLPLSDWLAHGPAVVAREPVEQVVLADREPVKSEGREDYRWASNRTDATADSYWLPKILFEQLLPDRRCVLVRDGFSMSVRAYESGQDARAGLSTACLRLARQQAGLPPLP